MTTLRGAGRGAIVFLFFIFGRAFAAGLIVPGTIDLGVRAPSVVSTSVAITNKGPAVTISRVDADCECISVPGLPLTIEENSTAVLPLNLDLQHNDGTVRRMILVHAYNQVYPVGIQVTIAPGGVVMPTLEINANRDRRTVVQLDLANAQAALAGADAKFAVVASVGWLQGHIVEDNHGRTAQIEVDSLLAEGDHQATIEVVDRHANKVQLRVPASVRVPRTVRFLFPQNGVGETRVDENYFITLLVPHKSAEALKFVVDSGDVTGVALENPEEAWRIPVSNIRFGLNKKSIQVFENVRSPHGESTALLAELTLLVKAHE